MSLAGFEKVKEAKPILLYPAEELAKPCATVTHFNAELKELVDEMFAAMYAAHGVGIAANQIGINKRVAVIDVSHGHGIQHVLINPQIVRAWGIQDGSEGCLSVPEIREEKKRRASVIVSAQNLHGELFELKGTWLLARAIQHECDHLRGEMCLSKFSLDLFIKKQETQQ